MTDYNFLSDAVKDFCPYTGVPVGFILPWTTYHPECNSLDGTGITQFDLNMRRKAEVLRHTNNRNKPTKKQLWATLNRAKLNRKKGWATQGFLYTNPNVNKLQFSENNPATNILQCPANTSQPEIVVNSSTASDVPGKPINLYLNPNIPLTLFKKQYNYPSGGSKWPQTSWQPGDNGFPIGKAGRNPNIKIGMTFN
jgi:hypothetical protein